MKDSSKIASMKHKRNAILSFPLDDPKSGLKFSTRLAQENQWSSDFTSRAITEYRRFLILCAEVDHPVTPPDAVDQVWHLHLCYTESYWNDLCGKVLQRPLHHGPTRGGSEEQNKFHDWYEKTKTSYEELFNEKPPIDIWPSSEKRFSHNFRRIDMKSNLVISKPRLTKVTIGSAVTLGLVSCGTLLGEGKASNSGLLIFLIIVIVFLVIKKGGGGSGKGGNSGCSGNDNSWFGDGDSNDSGCSSGCGGGGCGSGCSS